MNINDVTEEIDIPENVWKAIFDKQMELAIKYKDIENMGDLLDTTKENINTAKGQKWIKDFAWRVVEELAEAAEAKQVDQEHYKEEIIDALHFLVELTIIAGYDENFMANFDAKVSNSHPWVTIYHLGIMCNTLKNKPWKQTQMLTDRKKFEELLLKTWAAFRAMLYTEIGDDKEVFLYYFKKNAVNKFRQRSKY